MESIKDFLAVNLPEICSVGVVIVFAYMGWQVWKHRP